EYIPTSRQKGNIAMTEKELKKLKRVELLELLVEQTVELDHLRQELAQAKEALANREILLEESGSMAEAALKLNGIFLDADAAAKQYIESIKSMWQRQVASSLRSERDDPSPESEGSPL
ncbi:MAG: hypothetical protein RR053_08380, partial [Evtepia sp.]